MRKYGRFTRFLISLRRVFGAGLHSFVRNTWLSTAATIVMTVTLSSILLTLFASYTSAKTIKVFTDKIDVSIYFKPETTKQQVDELMDELKNDQNLGVKELTYLSSEEVKQSAEAAAGGDVKELQSIAQVDPKVAFPITLRVKTLDTAKLKDVVKVAQEPKYAKIYFKDSLKDNAKRTAIERLGNIAKFLQQAGLVASVIFGVISILVILNTIRMAIFNRKDEIEIMQLLGASKWYIRGPFLVEASVYGIIAALLSLALFYFGILRQAPKLNDYIEQIEPTIRIFQQNAWLISLAVIGTGILIGGFSSYLAIRKHLRLRATK